MIDVFQVFQSYKLHLFTSTKVCQIECEVWKTLNGSDYGKYKVLEECEGHIRRQRLLKVWCDSVDCESADVDNETQKQYWRVVPTHHDTGQFYF